MKITVITVGKLKEEYLKNAVKDLSANIRKKYALDIIELPDEQTRENMSEVECNRIKDIEGKKIIGKIPDYAYVVALAIEGKEQITEEFVKMIHQQFNNNKEVVFIIGGSLGLSNEVLKKAQMKISFSKMTFPHQMMRVILLEQINRIRAVVG